MSAGLATSLDDFKKFARRLRKAFLKGEAEATERVSAHVDPSKPLCHADFLHVIAREAGHDSWPKLKFTLEAASLSRDERAERLKQALYFGQHWVTEKLLADDPTLKDDNFGLQVALATSTPFAGWWQRTLQPPRAWWVYARRSCIWLFPRKYIGVRNGRQT